MFYNSSTPRINWGGTTYTDLNTFQTSIGRGQNNLYSNPLFVNPAGNDFKLQNASPAKDSGITNIAYTAFLNRYGIEIAKDIIGLSRPQGLAWDIGAYEYLASDPPPDTTPPSQPTGLVIQ